MADNKKKKLEHIQVKDNGIKLSNKIGDELNAAKQTLENEIVKDLISESDETNLLRYKIKQNILLKRFKDKSSKIIKETETNVKNTLINDSSVNLTNKQSINLSNKINKGLLFLKSNAYHVYKNTINQVVFHSKTAENLKDQLTKHIKAGLDIGVVYQDGKHFQFDTYWEMKARTDIQQEIGNNMVDTGNALGVIFYIAAYFGDCAKDHADYQGKIYYDKDWESNAPKDRIEEIRNYINFNKLMTVQEVMASPVYFTTRPNCRHYFQYIDIDSVLGNKSVKELRSERNLNFNGQYRPDKYDALQKQRLNERNIRKTKAEIEKQEQLLHLNPGDKTIQSKIMSSEARVRDLQANQRDLIKQYDNLERRYDRESLGIRVDLGD